MEKQLKCLVIYSKIFNGFHLNDFLFHFTFHFKTKFLSVDIIKRQFLFSCFHFSLLNQFPFWLHRASCISFNLIVNKILFLSVLRLKISLIFPRVFISFNLVLRNTKNKEIRMHVRACTCKVKLNEGCEFLVYVVKFCDNTA